MAEVADGLFPPGRKPDNATVAAVSRSASEGSRGRGYAGERASELRSGKRRRLIAKGVECGVSEAGNQAATRMAGELQSGRVASMLDSQSLCNYRLPRTRCYGIVVEVLHNAAKEAARDSSSAGALTLRMELLPQSDVAAERVCMAGR